MPEHSVLLDTFLKLTGPSCCICHIQCLIQDFQLGGAICPSHQFSISSLFPPPPSIPMAFIQTSAQEPLKLSLLCMLLSMDFGSCFTFDLKFKPKYCFKKILYPENLHFLVLFLLNTIWSVPEWPRTGIWKGHICSNCGNPAMECSRSDTEHLITLSPLYTSNYY